MEGLAFQADKALLDTVFDGVVVIDLKSLKVSLANQAAASILGFDSPDDMVGLEPLKYIPENDRERIGQLLGSAASGNCLREGTEARVLDRRGKEIWILARGARLASNGTAALLASFRDITAQKLAEIAVREAERRQLELLDVTSEMILISQDWKVVFANRSLRDKMGLSMEALNGMSVLEMAHPDERETLAERYRKMMAGEFCPSGMAFRGAPKDGVTRWGVLREIPFTWCGKPAVMTVIQDVTEQKAAEDELRGSEERYRYLLENANESVAIIQDWRIAYVNRSFEESIGIPRESLTGLNILDLTHPDDRQAVAERYQKILNGEKLPPSAPLRGLDKDGKTRWAEVKEVAFIWEGRPAVLSMMVDVTEQREVEEALRASEQRYRLMADNLTDVIWALDMNLNTIYVSPSVLHQRGYTPEEARNLPLEQQMAPETLAQIKRIIEEELILEAAGGADPHRSRTAEGETYRRDGSRFWVEITASFLRDEQGKPMGIMGITRDITERWRAREALRESEEKYRALAEQSLQGLAIVQGLPPRFVYCNTAMARMTGYTVDELVSMSPEQFAELIYSEDREMVFKHFLDTSRNGGVEEPYQLRGVRRDGTAVWLEVSAIAVEYDGGRALQAAFIDITKRKEAEETLRVSEERYRKVVEHANEGIAVLQDGVMKYVNPGLAAISGFTVEEMVGKSFLEFTHPDDRQMAVDNYVRRQRGEEIPGKYKFRFLHKDGSTGWAEMSATLFEWDGRVASLALIADITEQKKAEEELQRKEHYFRALLETSADGILVLDRDGTVRYTSPGARRLLDSETDRVGLSVLDPIHPDDLYLAAEAYQRALSGEPSQVELRARHRDGSWRVIEAGLASLLDDPAVGGVLVNMRDITESRKAEKALRESEEKFKALVENSAAVVFSIDTQGNLTYISPGIERLSGFNPGELMGTSCIEYVVPEDLPGLMASMERTVSGQLEPYEFRVKHSNGSVHHILTSSRPIYRDGQVTALIGVMVDVSDRKAAEEALRASEANYRNLFENTLVGMEVVDEETMKVVLANHSMARMFGFKSPEAMVGTEPLSYVLPEDLDWVVGELSKAINDPSMHEVATLRARTEDGRIIWVTGMTTRFTYVRRPSIMVSLVDVTAAKEAELKVEESEEKSRLLIDNAAEGIIVIQDGLLKFANPKCTEISGYTTEELLARSFLEVVHPEDRQMIAENHVKRLSGEDAPNNYRFRIVDKAGRTRWLRINTVQFSWEGKPAAMSMLSDVTDHTEAEEALRASEEKYRALYEDNPSMYFTVDPAGNVLSVNQFGCDQLGYTAEELLNQSVLNVFHEEDKDSAARSVALCVEHLGDVFHWELRKVRKSGSVMWVKETARAARGDDGEVVVFIVCEDISDRKKAEEALRDSENRYRLIAENSSDVIWTMDLDLNISYVSPSVVGLTGYTADEAKLVGMEGGLTPASVDIAAQAYKRGMAELNRNGGKLAPPMALELEMKRKDGSTVWAEIQMSFMQDNEGRVVGSMAVARNVDERRRAKQALEESEQRYRLLAENASDVIWVTDSDLNITYVSPSVTGLMGYSPDEIRGLSFGRLLSPDSLALVSQTYADNMALEGAKPGSTKEHTLEFEALCKDGSTIWMEAAITFVRDEAGQVVGFQGACRDITERRRAREILEENEERFRSLIEGSRDAIVVIDVTGKVTYSSPSARRITEGASGEMLSAAMQEMIHPDDLARVASLFEELTKGPDGSVVDVELRYRRDDGSWGVIEGRGTNRIHDPKINGIVVNYRDISERRQAEQAFRESESRYRLLAENVSDVIWSLDLKSKKSFFSPSVTRLLGYTVEEARRMKMKEVVSPTSYSRAMMAFSNLQSRQGGESDGRVSSTQVEIELMRKDGSFVWVDISVTLLRDAEGQPAEIFGVIRDITQRKRVEESLRTSEEYFRALIENAWDAIVIVDVEGKMLYESPSSARIMGYEPEEIVGRNLAEFVRPQDVDAIVPLFRRFKNEPGATLMVDAGFRHKDGHYIECEGTLQNLLHDSKINGIVANYRDMTDRRNAERAIRTSEERFRNLVEATSDFVWEVDPNGVYTYVSPRVREVLGYEVGEIIGRSIFDLVPSKESGRFFSVFKSYAAKREPFAFVESSRLHKDGRVIIMETSGVPFFGDDGSLLGYRGIGRDITSKRKVERDLENSLKKVEKTMEAAIQAISYTMETRDPYTTGHQKRVTQLACAISKEMGLAAWQIDGIRVAGLLHDIGKIAVPTEILSKPGKLSDIEFSMIKAHPKVGFDILRNVEFDWPIARIVVQHHERLDGSGYPNGMRGKDILLEARILAVADVVEAMSSHRPYRPALGIEKALAEVARGEGTLYDSEVVRACSRVINEKGFKFGP